MSKEQFILNYVLNRARGYIGRLDAVLAVREAVKAWDTIQREVKETR